MDENTDKKRELEHIAGVLKNAMREQQFTNKALGDQVGVHESMVSQWVTGRKPIAAEHAPKLASLLRLDADSISAAYRDARRTYGPRVLGAPAAKFAVPDDSPPDHALIEAAGWQKAGSPEERLRQLEDQVFSLNLALGLLAGVMREHRPIEADAVADALARKIPLWMREGVLDELMRALKR